MKDFFFLMIDVISLNFTKIQSSFSMGHVKTASQGGCAALHQGTKHRKRSRPGREDCNFHFVCSFLVHGTYRWMYLCVAQ